MTPTEWFDEYEPDPVMDGHAQWCGRHWNPCPRRGYNGIHAAIMLMKVFVEEIAVDPDPRDTERMNRQLEEAGRLCCKLGDERMYDLWAQCAPPEVR